jgi:hypothetical protein
MMGPNQAASTCTEPDTYWFADQHFKMPRPTSQTKPVHWCPQCLGSGQPVERDESGNVILTTD